MRIGLYEPVKQLIVGKDHVGDVSLLHKIAAGLATGARLAAAQRSTACRLTEVLRLLLPGALAISVASPTDLVKVRMQAEGKLPAGYVTVSRPVLASPESLSSTPRRYPSAVAAYGIIARTEGVRGLWTGVGPNIGRNALINAAELASYDQVRRVLMHFRLSLTRALGTGEAVAYPVRNEG